MLNNIFLRLFAVQIVVAPLASAFVFNSSRCADPPGFDSCWNQADANAIATFKAHCTNGTCTDVDDCFTSDMACAKLTVCVAYTEWIGCALNHCWNRVYNCEYQHLAIRAMENCPIADQLPPHVPAPPGAPGHCSCNIGFVFAEHLKMNRPDALGELLKCTNTIASLKAAGSCEPNCENEDRICKCCADSSATSTFFNTCPSTDPADVHFFPRLGFNHLVSAECSLSLGSSPNCSAAPYEFTLSPGPSSNNQFFDAANIPKNGTDPLTNNPGGLASPVSGSKFTWSLYDGGVATVNATITTWTGAGATTLASSTGSATGTLTTSGLSSAASVTTSSQNSGHKDSSWTGLLPVALLVLLLTQ